MSSEFVAREARDLARQIRRWNAQGSGTALANCAVDAEPLLERLVADAERYRDALAEIESFPISGYHAGAAQRIARAALEAAE